MVWIFVRVDVQVLLQVLILRELLPTKIAVEPLEPNVVGHYVPPQAKAIIESSLAFLYGAC